MAKETVTRLTDDLDGSEAKSTVAFTWAGTAYEIDLSAKNFRAFDEAIAPFVAASRRVGKPAAKTAARKIASRPVRATVKHDLAAVRAWAISTGHTVATRGRIAASLIEAYHAAQSGTVPSNVATVSEPAPTAVAPVAKAVAKKTGPARKASPRKATRTRAAKPAARTTTAKRTAAKQPSATKAPAAVAASE